MLSLNRYITYLIAIMQRAFICQFNSIVLASRYILCFGLALLTSLSLGSCGSSKQLIRIASNASGVSYAVTIAEDKPIKRQQLQQAIETRLAVVNSVISSWGEDSELIQLNRTPVGEWVDISQQLVYLLQLSQSIYTATRGAFDPSIGPLLRLWGFAGGEPRDAPPTAMEIQTTLLKLGFDWLEIDGTLARRTRDIELNISALADGYAADQIAALLKSKGYTNFLVELSGEVVTKGSKFGQPWNLAIETPSLAARGIQEVLSLSGQALATSGSYRNFFDSGGKRYQHILDPSTGYPANSKVVSVSVIGDSGALVDGYATAFMVLGEESLQLAPQLGVEVLLLIEQDGEVTSKATSGMRRLLKDAQKDAQ